MRNKVVTIESLETRHLLSAGGLDPTFGAGGVVAYPDIPGPAVGLATQSDGKYVLATSTTIYRFSADGTLDRSFGQDGQVNPGFRLYGLGIDHQGKINVGGQAKHFQWGAARYNSDGSPDTTFNGTGRIVTHINSDAAEHASVMTLQPDGKILVGGTQFNGNTGGVIYFDNNAVVARFNTDGSVDTGFGTNGEAFDAPGFNAVNAIAIAPDGDIAIAGRSDAGQSVHDERAMFANSRGLVTSPPVAYATQSVFSSFRAVWYRPDGVRVLADENEGFSDVYFESQGTEVVLDPLNRGGYNDEKINAIVTTADNKTLLAGAGRQGAGFVRFNADGTPDSTFGFGGFSDLQLNRRKEQWVDQLALLPNGDYLAAGTIGGTFPDKPEGGHIFVAHVQGGAHAVGNLAPRAAANFPNAPTPASGASTYEFTVTYAAEESIDLSSLGSYDIRVVGPHGYSVLADLIQRTDRYDGRQPIPTYSIDAPTGGWNRGDNGRYSIYLRPNQVVDNFNHFAPAGIIGTFTVHFPRGHHSSAGKAVTRALPPAPPPPFLSSPHKRNDLFDA
jgi:uncharacterized delta-60 repeat protein